MANDMRVPLKILLEEKEGKKNQSVHNNISAIFPP